MKQKICAFVFGTSLLLIIGIVGGIDCGEPLTNMLWTIPLGLAMVISGIVGRFIY